MLIFWEPIAVAEQDSFECKDGVLQCQSLAPLTADPYSEDPRAQFDASAKKRKTPKPKKTKTPKPRATKKTSPSQTPTRTPSPTPEPTRVPVQAPTPTALATPTKGATQNLPTPSPTVTPTSTPTKTPTATPTRTPTEPSQAVGVGGGGDFKGEPDCSGSEPEVRCTPIETACKPAAGQLSSLCSGGLLTQLDLPGGITLYHNSHKGPSAAESIGFGLGVTSSPYLEQQGDDIQITSAAGDVSRYKPRSEGLWESVRREAGDLSTIKGSAEAGLFEQLGSDRKLYTYDHRVSSGGKTRWYLSSIKDPHGNVTRLEYRGEGSAIPSQVVWPAGKPTRFVYDDTKKVITEVIAPVGLTSKLRYDTVDQPRGRLASITFPDGKEVTLTYDRSFNLITQLKDKFGQEHRFAYAVQTDGHGVLTTLASAEGVTTRTYGPRYTTDRTPLSFKRTWFAQAVEGDYSTTYVSDIEGGLMPSMSQLLFAERRDSEGKTISKTDAKGMTTTFFYGADGALVRGDPASDMPYPTAILSQTGSFEKIQLDPAREFVPTKVERFSTKGDLISTDLITWDPQGVRMLSKSTRPGSGDAFQEVKYSYTAGSFSPTSIETTYRSSSTYDSRGRVVNTTEPDGVLGVQYDSQGDILSLSQGGEVDLFERSFNQDGSTTTKLTNPWSAFEMSRDLWGLREHMAVEVKPSGMRARFNFGQMAKEPESGRQSLTAQVLMSMPPAPPSRTSLACSSSRSGAKTIGGCGPGPGGLPSAGGGLSGGSSSGPSVPGSCSFDCDCTPGDQGCEDACMFMVSKPRRGMCGEGFHEFMVVPPCNPECANKTDCAACTLECRPD